jgi:hypothetical protein
MSLWVDREETAEDVCEPVGESRAELAKEPEMHLG